MTTQTTIGLIAVRSEAAPLLKFITAKTSTTRIQARFHRGMLAGRNVILAEVGPGKVHTAAATQHLIDRYNTDLLISCGSAGALDSGLRVGDGLLADKVVLYDNGLQGNQGFQHLGIYDNDRPDGLHYHRYLRVAPELLTLARQAAESVQGPKAAPTVQIGCLASGDQIIAADSKKRWLNETFDAVAVDMESGAMAQVAFINNIPWLAIRAISDTADSAIDFNLPGLITYSDEPGNPPPKLHQTMLTMAALAKKPTQLKTIWQLRRAIQQAARQAARLTAVVVKQL